MFNGGVALASELNSSDLSDLPKVDIYLLGERHGSPIHHANQAAVTAKINPRALIFEMLSPAQVASAKDVSLNDADALEKAFDWNATGWPDFALYAPIFAAAPSAVLYGAAVPISQIRDAMQLGAAGAFEGDAKRFGLDLALDQDEQDTRETYQAEAHCNALPAEMLPGMVEVQRLRDVEFSRVALAALEATGGPVVVITGNGHARRDWGMPVYLTAAAPESATVAIGQLATPPSEPVFDHWMLSEPVKDEEDPCAAFDSN